MPQMSPLSWGGLGASVVSLVLILSLVLYFLSLSFAKFKSNSSFLYRPCKW